MNRNLPTTGMRKGAVIVFEEGVTNEQISLLKMDLRRQGLVENINVQEFDPRWGGPVWYVP
jgi:hypothetical protein